MKRLIIAALLLPALMVAASAQKKSPTEAVVNFYRVLKNKQYFEGFRHSVYRAAVEGLSTAELQDLEKDFARTFAAIPDKIEPRGEQVTGDTAIVFLKFDGIESLQQVSVVRVGDEWLVGDKDSLSIVRAQGRAFFFNTRILVNEAETYDIMIRMVGAQLIYSQKFNGRNASLEDLIRLSALPKDFEGKEANGYRFTFTVSEDKKSFFATATPIVYDRTGRLSFYADVNGVRAADLKGRPASAQAPPYQPR